MSVRQGNVIIAGGNSVTVDQALDINSPNAVANSAVVGGLNGKQDTITGAATTITTNNLAAARAVITDASGKVAASTVTSTELGYMHGVTSAVQTQINAKANDNAVVHLAGTETITGDKTFSGSVSLGSSATAATPAYSDNDTSVATTAMVHNLNDTQRTNCITEIPQDIKLELNDGTLTLKAGSKVYVPNGAGVFDVVTTSTDLTVTKNTNVPCFVYYYNNTLYVWEVSGAISGTTAPTGNQNWYDTTNNKIKRYLNGSVTIEGLSFPLTIVNGDGTKITSIDQVFNGFGYIGSTIFALPGLKGLAPNGRNADGTLKSNIINNSSVITRTFSQGASVDLLLSPERVGYPISTSSGGYDEKTNNYVSQSLKGISCKIGYVIFDYTGKVVLFEMDTAFHAVGYSDSDYIANCAMPSDEYLNLTPGATGSTYVMSADGYIHFWGRSTSQYANIGVTSKLNNNASLVSFNNYCQYANNYMHITIPVSKGQTVEISYFDTDTLGLRFVYANGAK